MRQQFFFSLRERALFRRLDLREIEFFKISLIYQYSISFLSCIKRGWIIASLISSNGERGVILDSSSLHAQMYATQIPASVINVMLRHSNELQFVIKYDYAIINKTHIRCLQESDPLCQILP